jgi:hypothetical protein
MSDHSEIQTKILEWQRRWNIADGDPAMALIELLNIYGYRGGAGPVVVPSGETSAPTVSVAQLDDAVLEQIRSQLFPAIERLGFQTQDLKQKMDTMALDSFTQQVAGYHEGIDYCTKKLDVVKKDADALVLQLGKVANSINPISRTAIFVLLIAAFLAGIATVFIFGLK